MFSWTLEKAEMLWYVGWLESMMERPLWKSWRPPRPYPPCLCFLLALWILVAYTGGKVKEDRKDRATWGRGLRRMGRLALSSDLVPRDTGNSLHKGRGKARSQAVSLSPWQQSNRIASRCGCRLHSCLQHASGHTGKPGTLEKLPWV